MNVFAGSGMGGANPGKPFGPIPSGGGGGIWPVAGAGKDARFVRISLVAFPNGTENITGVSDYHTVGSINVYNSACVWYIGDGGASSGGQHDSFTWYDTNAVDYLVRGVTYCSDTVKRYNDLLDSRWISTDNFAEALGLAGQGNFFDPLSTACWGSWGDNGDFTSLLGNTIEGDFGVNVYKPSNALNALLWQLSHDSPYGAVSRDAFLDDTPSGNGTGSLYRIIIEPGAMFDCRGTMRAGGVWALTLRDMAAIYKTWSASDDAGIRYDGEKLGSENNGGVQGKLAVSMYQVTPYQFFEFSDYDTLPDGTQVPREGSMTAPTGKRFTAPSNPDAMLPTLANGLADQLFNDNVAWDLGIISPYNFPREITTGLKIAKKVTGYKAASLSNADWFYTLDFYGGVIPNASDNLKITYIKKDGSSNEYNWSTMASANVKTTSSGFEFKLKDGDSISFSFDTSEARAEAFKKYAIIELGGKNGDSVVEDKIRAFVETSDTCTIFETESAALQADSTVVNDPDNAASPLASVSNSDDTTGTYTFVNDTGVRIAKKVEGATNTEALNDTSKRWAFNVFIKDSAGNNPKSGDWLMVYQEANGYNVSTYSDRWSTFPNFVGSPSGATFGIPSNSEMLLWLPKNYKASVEELPQHCTSVIEALGDDAELTVVKLKGSGAGEVYNNILKDDGTCDTYSFDSKNYEFTNVIGEVPTGGEPVHLIIDYNLNGKAATGHTAGGTVLINGSNNPIDCGTVHTGDRLTITLPSGITSCVIPIDDDHTVTAHLKGIYDNPNGTGTRLNGSPTATTFDFTVPTTMNADTMLTLYACWDFTVECTKGGVDPLPEGEIFPVYFDQNYIGGGITSIEVGRYEYWHRIDSCTLTCGGESHSHTADTEYEKLYVTFGFVEPYEQIKNDMRARKALRNGWIFCGWSKEPYFEQKDVIRDWGNSDDNRPYYDEEVLTAPTESTTYFAVWIPVSNHWYTNGGYYLVDGTVLLENGQPLEVITQRYDHPIGAKGDSNFHDIMNTDKPGTNPRRTVPQREGYQFNGWYYDLDCMIPINEYEAGIQPGRSYFAGWDPDPVYVNYYDNREGGTLIYTQEYEYGDTLMLLKGINDTDGQIFKNWAVTNNAQFAGTNAANITGLTNSYRYTGGNAFTATNPILSYHSRDTSEDGNEGAGRPDWAAGGENPNSIDGNGYWTLDLESVWQGTTASFKATIDWRDFSNNDGARPQVVNVGLLSSLNNKTVEIHPFKASDYPGQDVWEYTFTGLPITNSESSVEEITYSIYFESYVDCKGIYHEITDPSAMSGEIMPATASTTDTAVFTEYSYGINNYLTDNSSYEPSGGYTDGDRGGLGNNARLYAGKITFDHGLITTGDDVKFTIHWDDESDNDGVRPSSVQAVLLWRTKDTTWKPVLPETSPKHNAHTGYVSITPGICDVSEDGDTWTYTFRDYQKFTNVGDAIYYAVALVNDHVGAENWNTKYTMNGYSAEYLAEATNNSCSTSGVILSRPIERAEVPVSVIWHDENNRDGQRPEYVSVALMAYQWNRNMYCWEYAEVATKTIRRDEINTNTMTADKWVENFGLQKVYNGGVKIIYHLVVTSNLNEYLPEGSYEYGWVESAYGNQKDTTPQVIISQNTNMVSVPVTIYWDDSQNNDSIRPENVVLQLYAHAPGETPVPVDGRAYRVTLTGDPVADNWYYTFSGMPKYADNKVGVELIYTVQVAEVNGEPLYGYYIITANGEEEEVLRYEASYLYEDPDTGKTNNTLDFNESERAYVKLSHICETKTMNFSVNWHDDDDRDAVRPDSISVDLCQRR